jgi:hypothetical protein
MKNQENNSKAGELRLLIKSHDWYYDYSDDQNAWARGNDNEKRILRLVKELDSYGIDVYNQLAPEGFKLKREA